jgi:hypothetical protein
MRAVAGHGAINYAVSSTQQDFCQLEFDLEPSWYRSA